jgi:hypothetical protein
VCRHNIYVSNLKRVELESDPNANHLWDTKKPSAHKFSPLRLFGCTPTCARLLADFFNRYPNYFVSEQSTMNVYETIPTAWVQYNTRSGRIMRIRRALFSFVLRTSNFQTCVARIVIIRATLLCTITFYVTSSFFVQSHNVLWRFGHDIAIVKLLSFRYFLSCVMSSSMIFQSSSSLPSDKVANNNCWLKDIVHTPNICGVLSFVHLNKNVLKMLFIRTRVCEILYHGRNWIKL